jgi:hypothetical protein
MTNDEARMTKEIQSPKSEGRVQTSGFVIRHSFVIRISSFVIFGVPD